MNLKAPHVRLPTVTLSGLERDDFSSNRHPALAYCRSMIFSEKPVPTFRDHALSEELWGGTDGGISRFDRPGAGQVVLFPADSARLPPCRRNHGVDSELVTESMTNQRIPRAVPIEDWENHAMGTG